MIETNELNDEHCTSNEQGIDPGNSREKEINATDVPAKSIKAIDKTTVHRICSGQVVLTLATAVKELVENSIDAASASVEVRLKEYGSCSIEVSDNGKGVEPCDFEGLALKHHTSKLQDFGDLIGVTTFGFRGEALSSLCALSNVTVITRHQTQAIGTKLTFNTNGKLIEKAHVARSVGTTVSLQNLFHTLPVRHKEFLRNLKKEFSKMVQVLYSYCLISTNVRILCTNQCGTNGKTTVVSTESHSSLRENISSIFGPKQVASLLEIKQRSPDDQVLSEYGIDSCSNGSDHFQLDGFVSSCEHGKGRSAADRQFYFINSRPCDPAKAVRVVNEVYHHYNKHQFPAVVLNIRMKKEDVDVNVTPDKRQIMVNRERLLIATIKMTLICLYESIPSTLQLQTAPLRRVEAKSAHSPQSPTLRLTSSLAEKFSHISHASSSGSPTSGGIGRRKSTSLTTSTTFGGIKRSFAAHSDIQAAAKQPRLLDFCFKVNGSNSNVVSRSNTVEADHKEQNEEPASIDSWSPSNGFSMDMSGDLTSENRSDAPEHTSSSPRPSSGDTMLGYTINQSSGDAVVETLLCEPVTQNGFVATVPNGECDARNSLPAVVDKEPATPNGLVLVSSSCPKPHLANTPTRAIHSKTEEFLISLKSAKKRSSSATLFISEKANATETSTTTSSTDVIIIGVTQGANDSYEDASNACQEIPRALPDIIYDDVVKTSSVCATVRGKSLTVPFSIDSLRSKFTSSLSRKQEVATTVDKDLFRKFRAKIAPSDNVSAEDELKKQLSKDEFRQMSVIGQFNLGFIVTLFGADLFIVDQHATDEKYNFESLQRTCVLHSQKLIAPHTLELTAANEGILLDNVDIFSRNGFEFQVDIEREAGRRVALTKMPHSQGWEFSVQDVEEMIFMLSDAPGVMCRPSRVSAMFASRSCRKAVMIGTSLSHSHMRVLIDHMADMEQPWNCPHGRPTLRHLINLDLLAKFENGT